jgi:DNA-binding Lrp family transcriptional regulator
MTSSPARQTRIKLDRIDRRILSDLQDSGRMTNVELAKNAGISAPPCLRRVRNLEEMGLIKGYYTKVDEAALGYPVTIIALVKLNSVGDAELKKFEEQINAWPLVRESYMMTGEHDFMMRIVAQDWDAYQQFLTNQLLKSANVATVKSSLTVRVTKSKPGVPIDA